MLQVKILEKQLLHAYIDNADIISEKNYFVSSLAIQCFDALKELINDNISFIEENILKKFSEKEVCIDKEVEVLYKAIIETEYKASEVVSYEKELMGIFFASDILSNDLKDLTLSLNSSNSIDVSKVEKLTNNLSEKLIEIQNHGVKDSYTVSDIWKEVKSINIKKSEGQIQKYPSGCYLLDKVLAGGSLYPGECSLATGHPGSGKTTWIDYLANCRQFRNYPTLQIDSERTFQALVLRKVCSRLRITRDQMLDPDYDTDYINEIMDEEIRKANRNNYFKYLFPYEIKEGSFSSTARFNLSYIEKSIWTTRKEMGLTSKDNLVAFIDLLSMADEIAKVSKGMNQASAITSVFNDLSALSKTTNSHLMGTWQQRRRDESKKIRDIDDLECFRPTTEDIKDSSGAEERCRVIFGLYRKKHFMQKYLKDFPLLESTPDILEIQTIKNNDGPMGSVIEYLCEMQYNKVTPIFEKRDADKSKQIAGT